MGTEAREREAAGGRQGKEGKGWKGNKVQGIEASQFLIVSIVPLCLLLAVRMQKANSVLQRICSAVPSIPKPLASARLSITSTHASER